MSDQSNKEEVRKAIRAIVEPMIPIGSAYCKVKTVDWPNKTCSVILDDDEDLILENIRLGFDKFGVTVKPAIDSIVLVMFVNNSKTVGVVMAGDTSEEIQLMGEDNGGVPIADKIMDNLNSMKAFVEAMHAAIPDALTSVGAGSTASGATGSAKYVTDMGTNAINFEDIESDQVKHGTGQ